jgi:hypothetical protein
MQKVCRLTPRVRAIALNALYMFREVSMNAILLVGVALNFLGALKLLLSAIAAVSVSSGLPQEYLQLKLFAAGVAAVFGGLYLYLYFKDRLSRPALFEFGVSNGVVAALFWYYIASNV